MMNNYTHKTVKKKKGKFFFDLKDFPWSIKIINIQKLPQKLLEQQ